MPAASSTSHPNSAMRRAFSKVDLLFVVFVVLLLLALGIPGFLYCRAIAQQHACKNNLKQIGTAYHKLLSVKKREWRPIRSDTTWMEQLKEVYADGGESIFICPSQVANAAKPTNKRVIPNATIQVREGFHSIPQVVRLTEDGARCRLSTGKIPVTPPSYALEIESAASDRPWDWNDLIMRVDPHADGSITITAIQEISSPYIYDLVGPHDELLVVDFRSTRNATYTFPPSAHKQYGYGINSVASRFSAPDDADKVLVLDYQKTVANVARGTLIRSAGRPIDHWPSDCAPRHGGALNVLFQDGQVKSMKPNDLDPRVIKLRNLFWLPENYQYEDPLLAG